VRAVIRNAPSATLAAAGSKISDAPTGPFAFSPPTIRIFPSGSRVAVCPRRSTLRSVLLTICANEVERNASAASTTSALLAASRLRAIQERAFRLERSAMDSIEECPFLGAAPRQPIAVDAR
jgi:hypothetical protein